MIGDLESTSFWLALVIQLWFTEHLLSSSFLLLPGQVCPSAHLEHTARWVWSGCGHNIKRMLKSSLVLLSITVNVIMFQFVFSWVLQITNDLAMMFTWIVIVITIKRTYNTEPVQCAIHPPQSIYAAYHWVIPATLHYFHFTNKDTFHSLSAKPGFYCISDLRASSLISIFS